MTTNHFKNCHPCRCEIGKQMYGIHCSCTHKMQDNNGYTEKTKEVDKV